MHKTAARRPRFRARLHESFFIETLVRFHRSAIGESDVRHECALQITSLDTNIGVVVVEKVLEHSKAYHLAHFWFHVAWAYPKHMGKRVPATTATNVMSIMATVVLAKVIYKGIRFG